MATDKADDFQQQALEMLRAQQEAYVAAVKAWREALAAGEATERTAHVIDDLSTKDLESMPMEQLLALRAQIERGKR